MIAQISGKIVKRLNNSVFVDVAGLSYEVLMPTAVIKRLDEFILEDGSIKLITYHYHSVEPSRSVPVLIGFLNDIEKDFFQEFIKVSGVGPRAALKALAQPLSSIAKAIDGGDISFLKSLPGIGQQRAKEIIAKLQGKVGKFALIQDGSQKQEALDQTTDDIGAEAVEVLTQLQYKRSEANDMVRKAKERGLNIQTTEDLLNEVYRQRLKK